MDDADHRPTCVEYAHLLGDFSTISEFKVVFSWRCPFYLLKLAKHIGLWKRGALVGAVSCRFIKLCCNLTLGRQLALASERHMGQPLVCKSAREVDISVGRGGPAVADVWKPREFVWAVLLLQPDVARAGLADASF